MRLLSRFLLTLVFSWLVAPMWVALAHWRGFGADPTLHTLLLTQGACVPFQLLLNECLAVGRARVGRGGSVWVVLFILGAQVATCVLALDGMDERNRAQASTVLAFSLACALSNFVSYKVACVYYGAALNGRLTHREAACIGMVPGLSMLGLYTSFFEARARFIIPDPVFLAVLVPFPACLQWILLRRFSKQEANAIAPGRLSARTPAVLVGAVTTVLMINSGLITRYREQFSEMAPAYGALILVALNALSSVANTVTRARYLAHGHRMHAILAAVGFLSCVGAWILFAARMPSVAALAALLGLQLVMIAVIEYARGLFAAASMTETVQRGRA